MGEGADRPCRVAVIADEWPARSYRWVIRALDGAVLARSPYAFATEAGAALSAACWRRTVGTRPVE